MSKLDNLWKQGQDFLGVRYPIMCGAMTWISGSGLVSAVSNAGAFACIAAGNMPPEELAEEIDKTKAMANKPFAINLITIAPNYKQHLRVALEKELRFIIFAGSFPRASEIKIGKRRRGEINQADAQYEVEKFWVGALRRAVQEGDVESGSLMAGQSVGMMNRVQPLKEMLAELVEQAEDELEKVAKRLRFP